MIGKRQSSVRGLIDRILEFIEENSSGMALGVEVSGSIIKVTADLAAGGTHSGSLDSRQVEERRHRPFNRVAPPASTGAADISREAILRILRDHPAGFSVVELTRRLGGTLGDKKTVRSIVKSLMNERGEDRLEQRAGRMRLMHIERSVGRKRKSAPTTPGTGTRGGKPAQKHAVAKPITRRMRKLAAKATRAVKITGSASPSTKTVKAPAANVTPPKSAAVKKASTKPAQKMAVIKKGSSQVKRDASKASLQAPLPFTDSGPGQPEPKVEAQGQIQSAAE